MCGITGQIASNAPSEGATLDRMCDALTHRGPDDRGVYRDGEVGLAMRRLSILDIEGSRQPLFNEDSSLCLVFNGEIYNYRQLRTELLARGHRFATDGDGETILHLYEEFGTDCVKRLRGMFSFALWDKKRRKLVLAVDHYGIKPLYYFQNAGTFVFGSEIKSLLEYPEVEVELNCASLEKYLTFLYVPGEETLLRGVRKLPPGHILVFQNGSSSCERYFELGAPEQQQPRRSDQEWVELFLAAAEESVRAHMISDVPVGAFLSGGVDSSLMVALMSKVSGEQIRTFSIGYDQDGANFDERQYARIAAGHCRTEHRELIVTSRMAQDALPELLSRLDVPMGDASVLPNYLLAGFAREHVKVALSGLGCDELCAGYERHLGAILPERFPPLRWLLGARLFPQLMNLLPDSRSGKHWQERLKRFAASASLPFDQRFFSLIAKFSERDKRLLLANSPAAERSLNPGWDYYARIWSTSAGMSDLQRILKTEIETYLPHDLLALSDRTSMSHSLEVRVPFVDQKFADFMWNMPDHLKLRGITKKFVAKKAAERLLPREIIYRPKKGFSVPLTVWYRGALREYVRDNLSASRLKQTGFFNPVYVQKLLDEHFALRRNHDEKIFALLSFMVWYNQSVLVSREAAAAPAVETRRRLSR